jgi:hypothetical protein
MTRLLIDNVNRIKPGIGAGNPDPTDEGRQTAAAASAPSSPSWNHSRNNTAASSLNLAENNLITFPEATHWELRQLRLVMGNGTPQEVSQLLKPYEKMNLVYTAAGAGFGQPLQITLGDEGWTMFRDAMELRNRVAHPKRHDDLWIFEGNLQTVDRASEWFKTLQNEFVRIARAYREQRRW